MIANTNMRNILIFIHHMMNQKPTLLVFSYYCMRILSHMSKVSDGLKEYEQENVASRIGGFFSGYNKITR